MADEYRKFNLNQGQTAPSGNTGVHIPGGNVWIGENGTFPSEISSSAMTQEEIDFYAWKIAQPDRTAAAKNVFEGSILWDVSYAQVDAYIENNVIDISPSAKEFLKMLAKITVAHLKFNGLIL